MEGSEPIRLQRLLAQAGVASRRKAEVLIRQGRVTVNGEHATLGMQVSPGDSIRLDGVEVGPEAPCWIALNKPVGVVTTLDDPQGRHTVAHLVDGAPARVFPVGRLDQDTAGLLLMTNDGELAHRLTHPSFGVEKTYLARVDGRPSNAALAQLRTGVELEDGPTAPAQVRLVQGGASESLIEIVIHEGRNRQVRRMCDFIGHPVRELARTKVGPLSLGSLTPGEWRPLEPVEVRRLRKAVGLSPARHRDSDRTDPRSNSVDS